VIAKYDENGGSRQQIAHVYRPFQARTGPFDAEKHLLNVVSHIVQRLHPLSLSGDLDPLDQNGQERDPHEEDPDL